MSLLAPEPAVLPRRTGGKAETFAETTLTQAAAAPELSLALDGSSAPAHIDAATMEKANQAAGEPPEDVADRAAEPLAGASRADQDSQAEDDTQALLPELRLSADTQPDGLEEPETEDPPLATQSQEGTEEETASRDVLETRPTEAERPSVFGAGDLTDDSSDGDDDLDATLGLRPSWGHEDAPIRPKKPLSRLKRKVSVGPASAPGSPTLLGKEAEPTNRPGRALQAIDSDSDEEAEGVGCEPKGKRGAALASDDEEEEGGTNGSSPPRAEGSDEEGDEQEAVLSADELNRRTQTTIIEHGRRSRVGGNHVPELKSLSCVLQKLKQCHEQAAKRAPVIALDEAPQPAAKMSITDIDSLMNCSGAAMADDSDDELILEDSQEDASKEGPADGGPEVRESPEEDPEGMVEATAIPVLAGVMKGSKRLRGLIAAQRQITAAQLEGLDLATADRVPEPLEVEEEEEDLIIQDYEAMEEGSDAEVEYSDDEQGNESLAASGSDDEMDEEMDQEQPGASASELGDDDADDQDEPEEDGDLEETSRAATARRAVRLAEMSDDEDDVNAAGPSAAAVPETSKQARAFVEMEAEMSDDEGHDGDEEDDDDAQDGMLKGLIGTAKEGAKDEAIRAQIHAEWEADRDREELHQAVLARRHGYKRGIDVSDDEDENRAARRRRRAAAGGDSDDDEGPRPEVAGVVDLLHEDPDDEAPASPLTKEILQQDMLRTLNRHCDLDTALGQGLDESSQGMMKMLQGRSDSHLCSSSEGAATNRAGLLRLGSSRMGLFDISNHETSNHATFLGRTTSVASRGGGGGKSTFTFAFNSQSQSQAGDLEMPASQASAEYGESQNSRAPTSFAGLLPKSGSGGLSQTGAPKRGKTASALVSILGSKRGKQTDAEKRIDGMDLSSVLNAGLGRA